jgi:diguanylate cyclase
VRSTDLATRLGGDEFGVIAAQTSAEQAGHLVERICAALADAGVTASVGPAPFEHDGGFHGAWAAADAAMHAQKQGRRQHRR